MLIISKTPPDDFGVYLIFDPWANVSNEPLSYSDSLLILDVVQKSHDPKSPPINLIDKIKELILFTI